MEHKIEYALDGGVIIDGTRLDQEQTGALVKNLLTTGHLEGYLTLPGPATDLEAHFARLLASKRKGDLPGVVSAFSGVCGEVLALVEVSPEAAAPEGAVPTTRNLGAALRAGGEVVERFPLESHNGRRDAAQLRGRAQTIEVQDRLLTLLTSCGERARKSVGGLAQESVDWVRVLLSAIAPAEPRNPPLSEAAAPMHDYFAEPVARGLETRRIATRAAEAATARATAATLETARSEARAELRGKLDDQFAALLGE